jgi:alkaline phosphatase D
MVMRLLVLFVVFFGFGGVATAQVRLVSAPMPGYSAMREVTVWAATNGKADVYLEYTPVNQSAPTRRTETVISMREHGYTVHLVADSVEPGTSYNYTIYVDGQPQEQKFEQTFETQPLWQHRTDPPEVNIAIGSCAYINQEEYDRPGKGYGRNYEIFSAIDKENPQAMVWLGDNIYLREVDFDSRTGVYLRNAHARALPKLLPLLSNTHHYAIWDDHDYGPNNADRSYIGKHWTRDAFMDYWANPSYGFNGEGITTQFQWYDAHFFLLDNRWWRTSNERLTGEKYQLGAEQIEWLIDALKYSRAPFKFVCVGGQVLNTADKYENLATCPEERAYLIQRIIDEEIDNVIFLTGDRHHSELSKLEKGGITLWDLTVSPLTSGSHDATDEGNMLRIKGSHFAQSNYGILNITGPRKERVLNITLKDKDGKKLYEFKIPSVREK